MDAPQLALFEADRYHDPRVLADRTRRRAIAMLRPARRCTPVVRVDELEARRRARLATQEPAAPARTRAA